MDATDPEVKLRHATLARLEVIVRILIDRHGGRTTLAELLAITVSMARMCNESRVTIAEIAEATGLPKQSLSRWMHKRLGKTIEQHPNSDDQRVHDITLIDQLQGQEHLVALARLLKIR